MANNVSPPFVERTLQIEIESKERAFVAFETKDKELEEKIIVDVEKEEELKRQLEEVQEHRRTLEEERELRRAVQKKADVVRMHYKYHIIHWFILYAIYTLPYALTVPHHIIQCHIIPHLTILYQTL